MAEALYVFAFLFAAAGAIFLYRAYKQASGEYTARAELVPIRTPRPEESSMPEPPFNLAIMKQELAQILQYNPNRSVFDQRVEQLRRRIVGTGQRKLLEQFNAMAEVLLETQRNENEAHKLVAEVRKIKRDDERDELQLQLHRKEHDIAMLKTELQRANLKKLERAKLNRDLAQLEFETAEYREKMRKLSEPPVKAPTAPELSIEEKLLADVNRRLEAFRATGAAIKVVLADKEETLRGIDPEKHREFYERLANLYDELILKLSQPPR